MYVCCPTNSAARAAGRGDSAGGGRGVPYIEARGSPDHYGDGPPVTRVEHAFTWRGCIYVCSKYKIFHIYDQSRIGTETFVTHLYSPMPTRPKYMYVCMYVYTYV